jgi:hypothetical protein
MESQDTPAAELRRLEALLGSGSGTPEELSRLLAEDCVEFGSSGRSYNKRQILAALKQQDGAAVELAEFQVRIISLDVALVTYLALRRTGTTPVCSLRSSVWKNNDGRWQLVFHQGTPITCPSLHVE